MKINNENLSDSMISGAIQEIATMSATHQAFYLGMMAAKDVAENGSLYLEALERIENGEDIIDALGVQLED